MSNNIINPSGEPVYAIEPGDSVQIKNMPHEGPPLTVVGAIQGGGYACVYWSAIQGQYLMVQASPAALERITPLPEVIH